MSTTGPAIHTGYWVDHAKGSILGGTLTYSSNSGSQLISAATILVSLVGGSVWVLTAFWLHQRAVTRGLQDEFDAQKQVILRNTGSAAESVLTFYDLARTWQGHTKDVWKRSLTYMLVPFAIFAAFTVAGIFVGQIAEDPYQSRVLLKQGICGTINVNDTSLDASIRLGQIFSNISAISDIYARDCYARSTTDAVSCISYATPRIQYTMSTNSSCPIGSGNCDPGDDQAVNLRAESIESNDDLGINAKSSDRLSLRYNVTCAPVKKELLDSYVVLDNSAGIRDANSNYSIMQLRIGKDLVNNFDVPYNYSQVAKWWSNQITRYSVNTWSSRWPHQGADGFLPVSPFNLTDTDISIFVIAPNGIAYSAPNRDPIFSTFNTTIEGGYYISDHYFRAIVCGESYQVCKDGGSHCTPWSPLTVLLDELDQFDLNPQQNMTWSRLTEVIGNSGMGLATAIASPLKAADHLIGTSTSTGLPDDQWRHEVEGWFQAVLSRMQYISQSFAALPSFILEQADNIGLVILPPDTPYGQEQCSNQRIQTPPGYTSYNVFALVFIFVISLIIIGLAIFVIEFGHKLPHRQPGGKNYHKRIAHQADGLLQLQRMALEGAGLDGWQSGRGNKKEIPYTLQSSSRIPPPVVGARSRKSTQMSDAEEPGEYSMEDGGLLYYEKSYHPDDESDGPTIRRE